MSSQCSSEWSRSDKPRSNFRVPVMTRAAAFSIRWSLSVINRGDPAANTRYNSQHETQWKHVHVSLRTRCRRIVEYDESDEANRSMSNICQKDMLLKTEVRRHCDTKETHIVTGSDGPCFKVKYVTVHCYQEELDHISTRPTEGLLSIKLQPIHFHPPLHVRDAHFKSVISCGRFLWVSSAYAWCCEQGW